MACCPSIVMTMSELHTRGVVLSGPIQSWNDGSHQSVHCHNTVEYLSELHSVPVNGNEFCKGARLGEDAIYQLLSQNNEEICDTFLASINPTTFFMKSPLTVTG